MSGLSGGRLEDSGRLASVGDGGRRLAVERCHDGSVGQCAHRSESVVVANTGPLPVIAWADLCVVFRERPDIDDR